MTKKEKEQKLDWLKNNDFGVNSLDLDIDQVYLVHSILDQVITSI